MGDDSYFPVDYALGQRGGLRPIVASGYNAAAGADWSTIYNGPHALYQYRDTASKMKISSDSADDTAAGDGARTVLISGLGSNWTEISETVTTSGVTGVETELEFLRVFSVSVTSAGVDAANAGNIYLSVGTIAATGIPVPGSSTTYSQVVAGESMSQMAMYTVPRNHVGILTQYFSSAPKQENATVGIWSRFPGGIFLLAGRASLFSGSIDTQITSSPIYPEMSDVEVRGFTTTGTSDISATLQMVIKRIRPDA